MITLKSYNHYLISFIVNNYKCLWTRGTEMRMNIKMDTEDQKDERNTDIPEEVTELDNSMEHIMDENTCISIISKILNTLLIIKVHFKKYLYNLSGIKLFQFQNSIQFVHNNYNCVSL